MDCLPIVWSPLYEVDIGPHVFPTRKYRLVRDLLLQEDVVGESCFVPPEPASWDELARVHSREYLRKIREDDLSPLERLTLEVPFSAALREASILCCGGTLITGRLALEDGVAVHLGGGFHHAFADHGEGFCLLNDVAVAAKGVLEEGLAGRVAIVDMDVHHGNGTAHIFADDDRVFTFSVHEERNYPAVKPPSDLDIGLHGGTSDATYLALIEKHLPTVLDRSQADLVLFLAGADPYREDQLGGLGLSLDGMRRRDSLVFGACARRGVPVAAVLAGGYAFRQSDTVRIHAATVEEATRIHSDPPNP